MWTKVLPNNAYYMNIVMERQIIIYNLAFTIIMRAVKGIFLVLSFQSNQ